MEFSLRAARSERPASFLLGEPDALEAGDWSVARAIRHAIGWFDYDGAEEPLPEMPPSDGDETGGAPPLADAAKLLRDLAVLLQPPLLARDAADNILAWPAPLLPYQREGVMALIGRPALLLTDSMGLGKTIQAIAALRILIHRGEARSALIVCPAGLLIQWRRELARWAPELSALTVSGAATERARLWRMQAHLKLIGYETLRTDVLEPQNSPALREPWDVVILDEASRIKNRRSTISIACKRLPRKRRWALTGTPLENSMDDVESLLEFLTDSPDEPSPPSDGRDLKTQLHSYQLRRRREDVLPQLPPKQIHEIILELPSAQREAYDQAEQEGVVQLAESEGAVTIVHVLELISRLKQLCNYDPASGVSVKLADIAERMRVLSDEGQRALVFSQFTDEMFGIGRAAQYLQEFNPLTYTGSLSLKERASAVERFRDHPEHKALLLSLRAGGQGLNLQMASYVFHLDRWWNPAIEEQADSRAHRMGQTYPVTIYRYICARTIEERIDAKLRAKRKIFQEVVDDVAMELPSVLTEGEIFELVGLTRGRRFPIPPLS